jgi:hypothetical protein
MNVNDVAAAWKAAQAGIEPKWNDDPHAQVSVEMSKRFHAEVNATAEVDRGNENGMGRTEG